MLTKIIYTKISNNYMNGKGLLELLRVFLDCSQSLIFSYPRQDQALTDMDDGHLGFLCTEGAGVGFFFKLSG